MGALKCTLRYIEGAQKVLSLTDVTRSEILGLVGSCCPVELKPVQPIFQCPKSLIPGDAPCGHHMAHGCHGCAQHKSADHVQRRMNTQIYT